MSSIKRHSEQCIVVGLFLACVWVSPLGSQTATVIFGTNSGAAVPVAVDASGNLRVAGGAGVSLVDTSGTPADNHVAVFTDANTLEGKTITSVAVTVAGLATTGSSAANPSLVGGTILGYRPTVTIASAAPVNAIKSIILNADGSITISQLAQGQSTQYAVVVFN